MVIQPRPPKETTSNHAMDGRPAVAIELVAGLNAVNTANVLSLSLSQLLRLTGVQSIGELSAAIDELGYMELVL